MNTQPTAQSRNKEPGSQPAVKREVKPGVERAARLSGSMSAIQPKAFGYDQARHLLWRAGFGGTPQQIQTLASWGPERAVDFILDAGKSGDESKPGLFDRDIVKPPTAEERKAYQEARKNKDEDLLAKLQLQRQQRERRDRSQMGEMQRWWLKRMIETPRPLEEKMALFWHGHFATNYRTIENSYHMYLQNELFRTHAVGNFADLMFGIIRDPAMLAYLDNNDSRKGRPNENLAREIMELFSLGVGNYSERDIKEGARALTGYTFNDDEFSFEKNNHDDASKNILGRTGNFDGDDFVKIILEQRGTSQFICRKLYHFFAAELPPLERAEDDKLDPATRGAVREMAGTFLRSKYELKPVLRQLFLSEHFYSPGLMNEQIKSPAQLIVGAVRSLNTPVRDLAILNDALDLMGQDLFYPPSVKGWDGGRSWINTSTLYVRQNIMAFLLAGKKPKGYDATAEIEKYDPTPLLSELAKADPGAEKDAERVVEYLLRLTIGSCPSHAKDSLMGFIRENNGGLGPDHLAGLLLLITAMPEYQLC